MSLRYLGRRQDVVVEQVPVRHLGTQAEKRRRKSKSWGAWLIIYGVGTPPAVVLLEPRAVVQVL